MVVAERDELVRMIGRRGVGSVWEAVARAHARFQRKAQAAARLRSPRVVQVFDHGAWEGHPYIAMRLPSSPPITTSGKEKPIHLGL